MSTNNFIPSASSAPAVRESWTGQMTLVSAVLGFLTALAGVGRIPSWVLWIVVVWLAVLMAFSAYAIVPRWLAKRAHRQRERVACQSITGALKLASKSLVEMSSISHTSGIACLINGQGQGLGLSSVTIPAYQAHLRTINAVAADLRSDLAKRDADILGLQKRLMELMTFYLDVCRAISDESRQRRENVGQNADAARMRELSRVIQEANTTARDLTRSAKRENEIAGITQFREFLNLVDG